MPTEVPAGTKQRAVVNVIQNQSIMCPVLVQESLRWRDTKTTLNTEAEMNIISQCFAIKLKLKFMKNVELPQPEWINKQIIFCYNVYQMTIQVTDAWDWKKNSTYIFYSLNKTSVLFILNMFYFWAEGIMINCVTLLWHWNVEAFKYEILKLKKFRKILRNEPVIYALILSNKNEDVITLIILYKITDYTDVFFKKNTENFPEYEGGDYIIELNG